ncbi:MAG: hypothetical protein JXQ87_02945 [Bacteroidia bacterium]
MYRWLQVIIALALVLFTSYSYGQESELTTNDLRRKIKTETEVEKTKAQVTLISRYTNTNLLDSAFHLAYRIKGKTTDLDSKKKGFYLHALATAHYYARNNDSAKLYYLKSEKELNGQEKRTSALNNMNLGGLYFYGAMYDSSEAIFTKAINLFYEIGDTANAVKCALNRSVVQGRQEKPMEQIKNLKEVSQKLPKNDWKSKMIFNANLAGAFVRASLNDSGIFYYFKALKVAKEQKDSISQSIYLGNLSQAYTNIDLNEKALFYARSALKLNKKLDRKRGLVYSLYALGRLNKAKNDLDSALSYYYSALKHLEKDAMNLMGTSYSNVGHIHLEMQNLDSAVFYLKRAERIHFDTKNVGKLPSVYNSLVEASLIQNNQESAKSYLDSAKKYSFEFGTLKHIADYYSVSLLYYSKIGDFEQSRKSLDLYSAYSDSVINSENTKYALFMSQLYEDEKSKAAIRELKQEQEINELELNQAQLRSRILIISLSLAFLVAIVIAWALIIKRKSFKNLQTAHTQINSKNQQLEVLNKEIYHRAKNNLQTISSLLGLQQFDLKDEKTKEVIAENQNRINAMAFINKRLFNDNKIQKVDFVDFLNELIEELSYVYDIDKSVTKFATNANSLFFEDKEAIALGLISNELLTNAFKYGITNEKPAVNLILDKNNGEIVFTIYDNGKGFSQKNQNNSFGEEMIEMMAEQLKATVTRSNDNGAKVEVIFSPK